jgi:TetR/AcrR family transcriptional regulator, mexJK operon transcriptional repressor
MKQPAPTRLQPHPESEDRSTRKRRTISDAATELFLERGYLGTSIDQIAARAAVSKPTVYRFFADKEALLEDIVLGTLDRAGAAFRDEVVALAESDDLEADLHKLAQDYIAMVTRPSVLRLRRLVIGASHQLPKIAREYYERAPEQTIGVLAGSFQQLAARGLLQIDDPQLAASHFAFLVIGRVLDKSLFHSRAPFSHPELAAQAHAGVDAFLRAYLPRPAARRASPAHLPRPRPKQRSR